MIRLPKLIYIASPYSNPDRDVEHERYYAVMKFMVELLRNHTSYVPYSPILHFHDLADKFDLPKDAAWWRRQNMTMIRNCEELHVCCLTGWRESKGVTMEIQFAIDLGIKIVPWGWDEAHERWRDGLFIGGEVYNIKV